MPAFDLEVLVDAGSAGLQREKDYSEAITSADMGDAYYASAILGEVNGIWRFTTTQKGAHRDAPLIQARTYLFVNIGSVVPRPTYHQQFVARMIAAGNSPFWFLDVDAVTGSRNVVLCRLMEPLKTLQTQDSRNPLLYSYSLKFQQYRGPITQTP